MNEQTMPGAKMNVDKVKISLYYIRAVFYDAISSRHENNSFIYYVRLFRGTISYFFL